MDEAEREFVAMFRQTRTFFWIVTVIVVLFFAGLIGTVAGTVYWLVNQ